MIRQPVPSEKTPILVLVRPFQEFAAMETSGSILLLACTLIAIVWANSAWQPFYAALWHTKITIGAGDATLSRELHFWVNDALMAVFFFLVGLEIKRELLAGDLASPRRAALPIAAALGGILLPAAIYALINPAGPDARGWAVPMATDIAFAMGVMALLGDRVPAGLKVFLTALAIVDDIAAILVIAVFYTSDLAWQSLGFVALCVAAAAGANRLGVRHPLPYGLIGVALWINVLQSGIHTTVAGVLLAFAIPSRTVIEPDEFLRRNRAVLDHFETASRARTNARWSSPAEQQAIEVLEEACEKVQPALQRIEHALYPWVTLAIMPLFALTNAGVQLTGSLSAVFADPVTLGVFAGLLFGKPAGVTVAAYLAVRTGLAELPDRVSWLQIHGAGWLAGIGFTMSLFMAALAFPEGPQMNAAKQGILAASATAGAAGYLILRRVSSART
ncbi:MAG: Na+/H+ antiporter NhaA [Bryobacteraceae bacterium]